MIVTKNLRRFGALNDEKTSQLPDSDGGERIESIL